MESTGVTLNPQKCEFRKQTKFLGHVVSSDGIRPDPEKTYAIEKMPPPKCVSDLRRFMGIDGEIFTKHSRSEPAAEIIVELQARVDMGSRPRAGFCTGEGRTVEAYCAGPL